jgi:hypothetical protein
MGQSSINVTEGSGKRLNTWDRTISSVLVQDQFTLPSEYPYPTYSVSAGNIVLATAASHLLQIMAGSSAYVRIRRITWQNLTAPAGVTIMQLQLFRLTTAGTGGTSITPRRFNMGDAAAGATAMTLPTAKGTESDQLYERAMFLSTAAVPTGPLGMWEWTQHPGEEPIIIPAGTSNGLVIKNVGAVATATCSMTVEFTETSWL